MLWFVLLFVMVLACSCASVVYLSCLFEEEPLRRSKTTALLDVAHIEMGLGERMGHDFDNE